MKVLYALIGWIIIIFALCYAVFLGVAFGLKYIDSDVNTDDINICHLSVTFASITDEQYFFEYPNSHIRYEFINEKLQINEFSVWYKDIEKPIIENNEGYYDRPVLVRAHYTQGEHGAELGTGRGYITLFSNIDDDIHHIDLVYKVGYSNADIDAEQMSSDFRNLLKYQIAEHINRVEGTTEFNSYFIAGLSIILFLLIVFSIGSGMTLTIIGVYVILMYMIAAFNELFGLQHIFSFDDVGTVCMYAIGIPLAILFCSLFGKSAD